MSEPHQPVDMNRWLSPVFQRTLPRRIPTTKEAVPAIPTANCGRMKAEKLCDCQRQRYAKYRKEFTPFSRKDDIGKWKMAN